MKGINALTAGEYEQAISILKAAAQGGLEKDRLGNYYFLGMTYYRNKQLPEAITAFEEALKHTAKANELTVSVYTIGCYGELGQAYLDNRQYQQAGSNFLNAVERVFELEPVEIGSLEPGPGRSSAGRSMSGESWLLERVLLWVPLVLSLSLHEWAHAYSAHVLGDATAAEQGRLTLNPLEHIDPVGTFFLPLLGVPFGWAKPVPIDPSRFRGSIDAGIVLTALAGPLSNLALALAATAAAGVLALLGQTGPGAGAALLRLLDMLVVLSVLLACFNVLPIPPLDGSRVADALVPARLRPAWDAYASAGPV